MDLRVNAEIDLESVVKEMHPADQWDLIQFLWDHLAKTSNKKQREEFLYENELCWAEDLKEARDAIDDLKGR